MSSITNFTANFGRGARANRYQVELVYPSFVTNADGARTRWVAKAAQLPASTLGVIEIPFMGRTFKQAGDRTFTEWTVTIMNEETFEHRNALEQWSNGINSHEGNVTEQGDYFSRATVKQLDLNNAVIKTYTFENMWPSEVGAIEVGFDNNDTIEEFPVTFQLSHWESDTTT